MLALSKADVVTGPYDFTKYPDLPAGGENPAFIVYEKVAGGPTSYTFWMGGKVREVCKLPFLILRTCARAFVCAGSAQPAQLRAQRNACACACACTCVYQVAFQMFPHHNDNG